MPKGCPKDAPRMLQGVSPGFPQSLSRVTPAYHRTTAVGSGPKRESSSSCDVYLAALKWPWLTPAVCAPVWIAGRKSRASRPTSPGVVAGPFQICACPAEAERWFGAGAGPFQPGGSMSSSPSPIATASKAGTSCSSASALNAAKCPPATRCPRNPSSRLRRASAANSAAR
jgi:hypothetical protein